MSMEATEDSPEETGPGPGGRPTLYKPDYARQARLLAEHAFTDAEMAEFFGVDATTLYRWKAAHPEFRQSIKLGTEPGDDRVERSLFQRAIGYERKATKIFMPAGADAPVYAEYREHVPGEVAAMIFWLKNRRRDRWRDKTEQEVTGADGQPLVPSVNVTITRAKP